MRSWGRRWLSRGPGVRARAWWFRSLTLRRGGDLDLERFWRERLRECVWAGAGGCDGGEVESESELALLDLGLPFGKRTIVSFASMW